MLISYPLFHHCLPPKWIQLCQPNQIPFQPYEAVLIDEEFELPQQNEYLSEAREQIKSKKRQQRRNLGFPAILQMGIGFYTLAWLMVILSMRGAGPGPIQTISRDTRFIASMVVSAAIFITLGFVSQFIPRTATTIGAIIYIAPHILLYALNPEALASPSTGFFTVFTMLFIKALNDAYNE